jgi:hypothetical protein
MQPFTIAPQRLDPMPPAFTANENGLPVSTPGQAVDPEFAGSFVTRPDGKRVFYPNGTTFRGYVVPDGGLEQTLRQAYDRYLGFNQQFFRCPLWCLGLIAMIGFAAAVQRPSAVHLCLLSLPFLFALLLNRAMLSWQLGSWLTGLERVDGDKARQRPFRLLTGGAVATAGLTWLFSCLYAARIAELSAYATTVRFYPDLSKLILVAILCSVCLVSILRNWRDLADYLGPTSTKWLALAGAGLVAVLLFTGFSSLVSPAPSFILTQDDISCGDMRTRWSDVVAVSRSRSSRFSEDSAVFRTDDNTPSLPSMIICTVSGLNVGSDDVYRAIEHAWTGAALHGGGR